MFSYNPFLQNAHQNDHRIDGKLVRSCNMTCLQNPSGCSNGAIIVKSESRVVRDGGLKTRQSRDISGDEMNKNSNGANMIEHQLT